METVVVRSKTSSRVLATPSVLIMCEGGCGVERHAFIDARPLQSAGYAVEQVYGCIKCKTERRYGLVSQ